MGAFAFGEDAAPQQALVWFLRDAPIAPPKSLPSGTRHTRPPYLARLAISPYLCRTGSTAIKYSKPTAIPGRHWAKGFVISLTNWRSPAVSATGRTVANSIARKRAKAVQASQPRAALRASRRRVCHLQGAVELRRSHAPVDFELRPQRRCYRVRWLEQRLLERRLQTDGVDVVP